jgi:hypothetical protein
MKGKCKWKSGGEASRVNSDGEESEQESVGGNKGEEREGEGGERRDKLAVTFEFD